MDVQGFLDCGYITHEALQETDSLPPEKIRLLAAMAVTFHDSQWSDGDRDLRRGTTEVLERPCYWDKEAEARGE